MKIDGETRKYIRLLIRLRRIAAELDGMSEFELLMLIGDEDGISEDDIRRFAHSKNTNGGEGVNIHEQ